MTTSYNFNSVSKTNTSFLSKDATENDRQMKMQMLMIVNNNRESLASEIIWFSYGFFSNQLAKKFFREYTQLSKSRADNKS